MVFKLNAKNDKEKLQLVNYLCPLWFNVSVWTIY